MSDNNPEQEDVIQIQEETAVDQRVVPFMGDELAAALATSGDIYVSLNGIISALGLNVRGQVQRIQRTPALAKGLRRIPLKTSGGVQPTNCLRVDKVALWLVGIEPSRVKAPFRAKIEAYQEELAPVATRVFLQVMGVAPSPDPNAAALAEQYNMLMAAATFVADNIQQLAAIPDQLSQAVKLLESLAGDVQQLKREQTISSAQKQYISEAVQRIVTDSEGKPGEMKQGQIYAALYRKFKVSGYGEISVTRYEEVLAWLRDLWKRATNGTTPEQKSLF